MCNQIKVISTSVQTRGHPMTHYFNKIRPWFLNLTGDIPIQATKWGSIKQHMMHNINGNQKAIN